MAEYVNPDVLISDEELEAKLGDPSIQVIEVDEDTTLYGKGHIPGAIAWNWKTELHDPLRRDFIDQKQLAALLKKSELESRQLTSEVPTVAPATSAPALGAVRQELRALRDEVLNAVKTGDRAWVDVRSPEEFRGDLLAPPHLPQEQAQVPGHIPGASNIPWSKAAAEDGTFRSADELKELYANAGVSGDRPIIAYCRIGERSSHSWFVLTELLGYGNVKNYDGSWTEYGSLVGVTVER